MDFDSSYMLFGFDTETRLIAAQNLAPKIVCFSGAAMSADKGTLEKVLVSVGDSIAAVREHCEHLLDPANKIVGIAHNAAYDLAVIGAAFPDLVPAIFEALASGRIRDTRIREKLLALTLTGNIDFIEREGEKKVKANYSLVALESKYLGKDRNSQKTASDAWRLNYQALEDTPTTKWPREAQDYAIDDAVGALEIHELQEIERERIKIDRGIDPFEVQDFQTSVDFCLRLMSCWGFAIDHERRKILEDRLKIALAPDKHMLLIETGILRPPVASRPYKKNPNKMTASEPESINTTKLKGFVEQMARDFPSEVTIARTEPSATFPEGQISTDAEWLDEHSHLSPVLEEYQRRQSLQKLVTTELPRLCVRDRDGNVLGNAEVVHPLYDVLKRTGRTSAYGDDMVPSMNVQNVHGGIKESDGTVWDVRGCVVPRPGTLLLSIDYSFMELCTLAQKLKDLFGTSRLLEIINAGLDPHAWLGSQLCYTLDPDFRQMVDAEIASGAVSSGDGKAENEPRFVLFNLLKDCGNPEWEEAFKHWRKMAKPTGLGYPGGLGPKTFIKYAKASFGVIVTLAQATQLRDAWIEALPEMPAYFSWIKDNCVDPHNPGRTRTFKDENGNSYERTLDVFSYLSPMGMYRAGCDYCAAANGAGLQTPSAEGAKLAVWTLVRACYDPTMNNILCGTMRPIAFVHDEIIGEVLDTPQAHDYAVEAASLMVESFKQVVPDVNVKAQPVLMRRWNKDASPVFDANNRLVCWEPKGKEKHEKVQVA